ncbi:hypothetical protein [Cylindrospermum stagnale]|uniref:hypothetical protein n=1 Tax=Cylindrospermum stagnale TaxID=142864 RepID=UPI001FE15837|nr:hypothetical protein [Cylindrospermum stagnale]
MPSWFIGCLSLVSIAVLVGFGAWLWFWEVGVEQAVKTLLEKEAIAPKNPQMLYAVNENNTVFQSQNEGKAWKELN